MAPLIRSGDDPIAQLKADAEESFLSPGEVDIRLVEIANHCHFSSLGAKVSVQDSDHFWGEIRDKATLTEKINSASNIEMAIYCDSKLATTADAGIQRLLHRILEALKTVWAKEYRNDHGGLSLKASGATEKFAPSVRRLASLHDETTLAVVYLDLDKFKDINDLISHEEGNRALRSVYSEMHHVVRELNGLAFFDGGDEFILVLPTDSVTSIASAIWSLRQRLQKLTFGDKALKIDITVGVVTRSVNDICEHIEEVKTSCESLTKLSDERKTKKRGTITFEQSTPPQSTKPKPISPVHFFRLGISLSRSRQFVHNVFGDARLNLLAKQVEVEVELGRDLTFVGGAIEEMIDWLGVQLSEECVESHLLIESFGGSSLPKCSVVLAVMHGLSRAIARRISSTNESAESLLLRWDQLGRNVSVQYGEQVVWGNCGTEEGRLAFGTLITNGTLDRSDGAVIGVQIGFGNEPRTPGGNQLPEDFFVTHVRVDDRPRTGGGLPDFWQVALAQIMTALGKTEGLSRVLIWGESPTETETYKRLSNSKSWSVDDISILTGLSSQRISDLATRLPSQIRVISNSEEMLDEVFDAYQNFKGSIGGHKDGDRVISSVLSRALVTAAPLGQSEGIVCATAALAYPIVIDTLRKADGVRHSRDDSEQDLRELIAFKVKLTNPSVDKIPLFLQGQKSELDQYAQSVLLNEGGLIRSKLELTKQVSTFISHLSSYIRPISMPRSTRRACMVVPHEPSPTGEPKPLGLISVWATPRVRIGGSKVIDFVFVWRTVEAFIGLPYSLYGSIELAEQLVENVAKHAGKLEVGQVPILGELTYMALSLHLGSDQFHMRVAKHIVDLASD